MNTWAIAAPQAQPRNALAMNALDSLAGAVAVMGEPQFGSGILQCVNKVLPVDFWSAYRIYPDQPPQMFLSGSLERKDVSMDCFTRYRQSLYQQDKTFASARDLTQTGQTAMTLWNEAEIPSPHRDQIYRRHDIFERLSVVTAEKTSSILALNFYRFRSTGGYAAHEVDAVQMLARFLQECVSKHLVIDELLRQAPPVQNRGVKENLLAVCPRLTPRELDVCERLLRGWTYEGIAADLGLSATSIKTYRARAFDRLGIHFRNELFALAAEQTHIGI